MKNPLVEKIDKCLKLYGYQNAELVHETYSAESFGDAQALYRLGNLYLSFVRDRGNDMIDFISPKQTSQMDMYNLDDISLLMGWKSLDQMVERRNNIDFSKPLIGPVPSLDDSLLLVKEYYDQLQHIFSPEKVNSTLTQLKDISMKRSKALFGS